MCGSLIFLTHPPSSIHFIFYAVFLLVHFCCHLRIFSCKIILAQTLFVYKSFLFACLLYCHNLLYCHTVPHGTLLPQFTLMLHILYSTTTHAKFKSQQMRDVRGDAMNSWYVTEDANCKQEIAKN